MEAIFHAVIQTLGLDLATMMGVLATIALFAQLIGKAIPDDATGVLGIIRKIAKVIGLYTTNKTGEPTPEVAPVEVTKVSVRGSDGRYVSDR